MPKEYGPSIPDVIAIPEEDMATKYQSLLDRLHRFVQQYQQDTKGNKIEFQVDGYRYFGEHTFKEDGVEAIELTRYLQGKGIYDQILVINGSPLRYMRYTDYYRGSTENDYGALRNGYEIIKHLPVAYPPKSILRVSYSKTDRKIPAPRQLTQANFHR